MTTKNGWMVLAAVVLGLCGVALSFAFAWLQAQPPEWWKETALFWLFMLTASSAVGGAWMAIHAAIETSLDEKG